jgi:hypothetical protein
MPEEHEDKLFELAELSIDESSFLRFVEVLCAERESVESLAVSHDGFQGNWANPSLQEFLGAATRWAKDSQFGVRPGPKPSNPWQLFALFLWAGRGYE